MSAPGIVIVGGGFAGLWATLVARRQIEDAGAAIPVTLVSTSDQLTMRPRLYEPDPEDYRAPLRPVVETAGARLTIGAVTSIDTEGQSVTLSDGGGQIAYDRLVLATGSVLRRPPIDGAERHGFDNDTWSQAMVLEQHLAATLGGPPPPGGDTFVVIGAGFTGIEIATEMRTRIAKHAGKVRAEAARVVLLDRTAQVGAKLGPNPRPAIQAALAEARVELRLGVSVAAIDETGIAFEGGERIYAGTVIFATGLRAHPLAEQLPVACDKLGRVPVDDYLRATGLSGVYAAGDTAHARVDDDGHVALMSCQHALRMGRYAGYNAARELLALAPEPYRQERYVTCLDLGPAGAVFTQGWSREVEKTGAEAKAVKRMINQNVIYPPSGDKATILAAATLEPHVTAAR
jgi:NADH dehydrogenase